MKPDELDKLDNDDNELRLDRDDVELLLRDERLDVLELDSELRELLLNELRELRVDIDDELIDDTEDAELLDDCSSGENKYLVRYSYLTPRNTSRATTLLSTIRMTVFAITFRLSPPTQRQYLPASM